MRTLSPLSKLNDDFYGQVERDADGTFYAAWIIERVEADLMADLGTDKEWCSAVVCLPEPGEPGYWDYDTERPEDWTPEQWAEAIAKWSLDDLDHASTPETAVSERYDH